MKKFALLVGVEEYRDKMISRLQFARADATALAERLSKRCGFDHVRVLADPSGEGEPLLVNIVTTLRDIAGELRPEDLFLFFFAGHGIEKGGHGYLLARDSIQGFAEHGSLALSLLEETFSRLPASRRILLLDACRNNPEAGRGEEANRMGDGLCRDIVAVSRARATEEATTCLLTACKSGQRASEWPEKGHGVFTHFLLEGLDGAAWRGGELDFEDLAAYTHGEVLRWSSSRPGVREAQVPWYEKFGAPARVLLAARVGSAAADRVGKVAAAPVRVKCPACGQRNDPDETFECRVCKRDHLCSRHWDTQRECCGQCAAKLAEEERKREARKQVVEPEDLRRAIQDDMKEVLRALMAGKRSRTYIEQVYGSRLPLWRRAAEAGVPEGQWLFGKCYEEGLGVEKSSAEAVLWYRKAAEQGYAVAQSDLGVCYAEGEGVAQDIAETVGWYRKAAEQGYAVAQLDLGLCYYQGKGVAQDIAETVGWYRKAAEQGFADAQFKLAGCYLKGEGAAQNKAEAMRWYRKAAEQGHAPARKKLKWRAIRGLMFGLVIGPLIGAVIGAVNGEETGDPVFGAVSGAVIGAVIGGFSGVWLSYPARLRGDYERRRRTHGKSKG